jgi:malate dehydrogenase (oxaloacetate-decarboxylating)
VKTLLSSEITSYSTKRLLTGSLNATVWKPPTLLDRLADYFFFADALIYPGLGFGAVLAQSRELTDTMIIAGARRLASLSPALKDPDDSLLPDFGEAPDVNLEVAVAVAEQAIEEGRAGVDWKKEEVRERAVERRWEPFYGNYEYDPQGKT